MSEVQSMPNVSIREKDDWGFYGHSTINHDYSLKTIRGEKVVVDNATGLMWHQSGSDDVMEWGEAKEWIKKLNKSGYAGYDDWRLPTLEEAASLLESSKRNGNLHIDPVFSNEQFFILTGDRHSSEDTWSVNFGRGRVIGHEGGYDFVRPVRSVLSKDVEPSYQSGRDTGQVQVTPQQEPSYGDASHGKKTNPDGSKYVGGFVDGRRSGQGTNTWPDGKKYVGEFKDDKRHGQGTLTSPDGDKFVGEFKDDKMHGQGTYTWPNGEKYVGEFKDGKSHGQGTYTWPDGRKYVGEFKDGKSHGQGTLTSPDGEKYVGEFKDGKLHGQGTYTWPDGKKYVGEFKDVKRHGQGTFTWPNGEKYVGEWKDDNEVGGWYYWANGKRKWAYRKSNGKWKFRRKKP